MGFGFGGGFPFRLGGAKSAKHAELSALVDALSPAFGTDTETASYAECVMMASAVAIVWACNKRLTNQAIPSRMLEALPMWEEALKIRPAPTDTEVARRAAVAAKLRGLSDNAIGGVTAAVEEILGQNLDDILHTAAADEITYWPGVNPGPPGFEWSSNRARMAVKMNRSALTDADFESRRASVVLLLDALLPAWMRFAIGTGDGFTCNQGVTGLTLL